MAELYRSGSSQGAQMPSLWRGHVKSKYKAQVIAAHHVEVHAASRALALRLAASATSILADSGGSKVWTESAHPRITMEAGDFTDFYVYLVAEAHPHAARHARGRRAKQSAREESAMAAAASIEFGRRSYTNSHGEHIGASEGVRPLSRAMGMLL